MIQIINAGLFVHPDLGGAHFALNVNSFKSLIVCHVYFLLSFVYVFCVSDMLFPSSQPYGAGKCGGSVGRRAGRYARCGRGAAGERTGWLGSDGGQLTPLCGGPEPFVSSGCRCAARKGAAAGRTALQSAAALPRPSVRFSGKADSRSQPFLK